MSEFVKYKNLLSEDDFADLFSRLDNSMIPSPAGENKNGEVTFISKNDNTLNVFIYKNDGMIVLESYNKFGEKISESYSGQWSSDNMEEN